MSENKFIQHLKGKATAGSMVEIKNQATPTSFANMPSGTSNANNVYADVRGNATVVAQGTTNWKLNGANLVLATTVSGDGNDYTGVYGASGAGLWVNATYTFPSTGDQNHPVAMIFNPNTKWVLKLCGDNLLTNGANTIDFSLVITIGSTNIITKNFTVAEQANKFCKEFVIDFAESNADLIKASGTATMQVQLLCATASATARIYNGMTVFTALQRRVDGGTVATDQKTFTDVIQDVDDINDEIDQIHEDIEDLEEYVDDTFVRLDGNSIMTGPLKFEAGSMRGAVSGYLNGVAFWKMSAQHGITNIANLTDSQFLPVTTNSIDIGRSANKWKDLYLAGKAYMSVINNGYDIAIPVTNSADTFALKSEVDLAANSGRMITDQGVWYAKMYTATVPPAAEDGTNYADFSQTDGQGNPIIVIYNRISGAWVQDQTITPPAEYDGYVPITSKIWDIAEQAGQQGGRILWNHQSKTFTPFPSIVSFEDAALTGTPTAPLPTSDSPNNQVATKEYVDNASPSGVYHPGLFAHEWDDHIRYDVQWLRADTFSWQNGSVYEAAYNHLVADIDGKTLQSETVAGITIQFYLADDKHKICPASEASNVAAIYAATGVAWYYIIDTVNERFKLPRGKHNKYAATLGVVGNGMTLGFTDGITNYGTDSDGTSVWKVGIKTSYYGAAVGISGGGSDGSNKSIGVTPDPTKSGVIAQQDQDTDEYKYLYFYMGQFTQTAVENTAGLNAELFNGKVDTGHQVIAFQAPTAQNNYTWYRKYADGWVEQGGIASIGSSSWTSVSLPVEMADTNYCILATAGLNGGGTYVQIQNSGCTTTQITLGGSVNNSVARWEVKGMAA